MSRDRRSVRVLLGRLAMAVGLVLPGVATAEVIEGTADPDVLEGTPEADTLYGRGGADVMMGLGGDDTYFVDLADDEVIEGAGEGNDTVMARVTYALPIYVENLVLTGTLPINATGNSLPNHLTGNVAANRLNGLAGADVMAGRRGNDVYTVDNPGDRVVESPDAGVDTVRAFVSHQLGSNVENLILIGTDPINGIGNAQSNVITGNAASNILNGGKGPDTLIGAGGPDRLVGGSGNDVLTGGKGTDTFLFNAPHDETTNVDQITDFDPAFDRIRLEGSVFTAFTTSGPLGSGAFRSGSAAADSTDRILYASGTGIVRYDPDGTGPMAAVRFATLPAGLVLTSTHFVVANPVGTPVNYATQIQPIFNDNCTSCHSGGGAPQGLRLDSTNSYSNLVDVASNEVPSLKRVAPGDDTNSYLVQKIEGTAAVGARMPLNSPPLSASNIALIRRWIVEGAANSNASAQPPDIGY
jgi:hypothetical protein